MVRKYIDAEVKAQIMNAEPGTIVMLHAPVGSGKTTFCIEELWTHCRAWRKRMLLLVNRSALRGQLRQKILKQIGMDDSHGIAERGIMEFDGLTVTSCQYLETAFGNSIGWTSLKVGSFMAKKFDFVVCDEIHYLLVDSMFSATTKYLRRIPAAFPMAVRVYMSATLKPVRNLLLEMENICDLFQTCDGDWMQKYQPFQFLDISLEKKIAANIWQRERKVLELEAAEADYSYLRPVFYEETCDIVDLIFKQCAEGDSGKWLVFVDSKETGKAQKNILKGKGIETAFISADEMQEEDEEERKNILAKGRFDVHVLLTTAVLDNGVSIIDNQVTHIVLSGFEVIQAIQQAGRVRWKGKRPPIDLYICRHTAEFFNRRRFGLKEKLYAYQVIARGDESQIINFLINKGNASLSGIAHKGVGGKLYVNNFAGKALEYFIDELSENIALLQAGRDGYVEKVLGWFGLSYNPEDDLLQQKQVASKQQLAEFLANHKDTPISGEEWGDFRKELRTIYESATGTRLCSGRTDRMVGVNKVKEILLESGYILEGKQKKYIVKEERVCS